MQKSKSPKQKTDLIPDNSELSDSPQQPLTSPERSAERLKTSNNASLRNFISSGNDEITQDIVAKLKFISHITSNKVPDTSRLTMDEKSYFLSLYRTILARDQSRAKACKFFSDTINEAFILAFDYLDPNNSEGSDFMKNVGNMILGEIKNTIQGLENHKRSYPEDVIHAGRIAAIIEMINKKLGSIEAV